MFQNDTTSAGETARHRKILGKQWVEGMGVSKAANVALADSMFGKSSSTAAGTE